MLDELKSLKIKGIREKIDYAIVKPIIWLKHKLGLGFDPSFAEELLKPNQFATSSRDVKRHFQQEAYYQLLLYFAHNFY